MVGEFRHIFREGGGKKESEGERHGGPESCCNSARTRESINPFSHTARTWACVWLVVVLSGSSVPKFTAGKMKSEGCMCVREVLCEDVGGASFFCVWGPLYPSPAYIIVRIRRNCIQQGVPETSLSTSNFQTQFILYPHPARKSLVSYTLVWCQLLMIAQ